MIRFWVGVSAAFGAGGLIGAGIAIILTEDKFRLKYQESTDSFIRAMELARQKEPHVEIHVDTEQFTEGVAQAKDTLSTVGEAIKVGDVDDFKPEPQNPYHEAPEKPEPSWTILEEEDYHDDDGRFKGQITILPGDNGKPVFVEDDIEIANWEEKIGPSILRDFYALVPPNTVPAVLYIRNNVTDEDYEVIREQP